MTFRNQLIAMLILGCAATARAEAAVPARDGTSADDAGVTAPAAADAAVTKPITAQGPANGKFVFGLRLGYGLPMGSVSKLPDGSSGKMSDIFASQFPIWVDLGYQVTPNIMLGVYGQYGFGRIGSGLNTICDVPAGAGHGPGPSCSVADMRFGVQGQYHVTPSAKWDPWFGLGIGYEIARTKLVVPAGENLSVTSKGFEFANLQAGVDYKLTQNLGIGPFVSFSLGEFNSTSASGGTQGVPGASDITDKTLHEWLTIGLKGVFAI